MAEPTRTERPPVGPIERGAWVTVVGMVAVLGVAGFVNSFARIETAMRPYFGALAWTVPLAVDVGILVFTALDLLMAYRDLRSWWLRHVPRALVAVTVYLNAAGETATEGRVAHAVLPLMWVIAVEVAGTAVRWVFGLRTDRPAMDRIRRSRWLLDPAGTARLRRRMVLREETNLAAARDRDLAFELAQADMRDTYGYLAWRWKAPRRQRLLLRRGQIAPGTLPALALAPSPDGTGPVGTTGTTRTETTGTETRGRGQSPSLDRSVNWDQSPDPSGLAVTADRTNGSDRIRRQGTHSPGIQAPRARDVSHLLPRGRVIKARLAAQGNRLNRNTLTSAFRDGGGKLSNADAGALLAALRAEDDPTSGDGDR